MFRIKEVFEDFNYEMTPGNVKTYYDQQVEQGLW